MDKQFYFFKFTFNLGAFAWMTSDFEGFLSQIKKIFPLYCYFFIILLLLRKSQYFPF